MIKMVSLSGHILTDKNGHITLARFYNECKQYNDCQINIDLSSLKWIDANLCGLWLAMIEDLQTSNQLRFDIPSEHWLNDALLYPNNFNVLLRNKFVPLLSGFDDAQIPDERQSTIELKRFGKEEAHQFAEYIENAFLKHRGCQISEANKDRLQSAYCELFNNYEIHSQTDNPVYVCGQFFPKGHKRKYQLIFSMTDTGIGFFEPISKHTAHTSEAVTSEMQAVKWALVGGHSTKKNGRGGSGLKSVEQFCKEQNGNFHIATDSVYTKHDSKQNQRTFFMLKEKFKGVTVHLLF